MSKKTITAKEDQATAMVLPTSTTSALKFKPPKLSQDSLLTTSSYLKIFHNLGLSYGLSEEQIVNLFPQYLEGELQFTFLELWNPTLTYDEISNLLKSIRPDKSQDYFSTFISIKYTDCKNLEDYFSQMLRFGKLANLSDAQIIQGLTNSLPQNLRQTIAPWDIISTQQWYEKMSKIQNALFQNSFTSHRPAQNSFTSHRPAQNSFPNTPCPRHLKQTGKSFYHWMKDCKLPAFPQTPNTQNTAYLSHSQPQATTIRKEYYNPQNSRNSRQTNFFTQQNPVPSMAYQPTATGTCTTDGPRNSAIQPQRTNENSS
jgi:hypothetical protein